MSFFSVLLFNMLLEKSTWSCLEIRVREEFRVWGLIIITSRGWKSLNIFGITLTNQNSIREEIKCRLRSGNACNHSVQNLLSYRLLSRKLKIKIYRTITLPVVLYGCEAWSLTLREEKNLKVFENMVLRRIFGPRRDEVTGEWRRLHEDELSDLYSSPNIVRVRKSRRMRLAGNVARMGEERGAYTVFVGKPDGKRPLGRPRRR